MASLKLVNATKEYVKGTPALKEFNLDVADGEFVVLVGPSGCGKSTALRLIAGLEAITSGDLYIGDECMNDVASHKRDIAMVFQSYALYPHMTVEENMGFSLRTSRVAKKERAERVLAVAETLGLADLLRRKPRELSGGQRQRVAMGRAIIRQPQVFLMDEPLSNLDAKLRGEMREEISELQRRLGTTTVFVTHDQIEAMTMGDRVAVLCDGVLQQVAAPDVLYDEPANLFVASFIGSPPMSILPGRVSGEGRTLAVGDAQVPIATDVLAARPGLAHADEVLVGIRPEHATLVSAESTGAIDGVVRSMEGLGPDTFIRVDYDSGGHRPMPTPTGEDAGRHRPPPPPTDYDAGGHRPMPTPTGEDAGRPGAAGGAISPVITVRRSGTTTVHAGQRCRVGIDPALCHFFDSEGNAVR